MGFRTILVHLNHESRAPELIGAAAALARPLKSHVIGLYVMPPLIMPSDMEFPMYTGDTIEAQMEVNRAQADRIRAVFDRLTAGGSFVAEWRVHSSVESPIFTIATGVIAEARSVDLVIASQAQLNARAAGFSDVAERAALESGRPVLVIPDEWNGGAYGTKVAVAWNGSSESTRATFDSLPFLRQAGKVYLVTIASGKDRNRANSVPGAEIAATLARHGINVEVQTIERDGGDTGDAILSQIRADGANLLVMGAYGRSRFREFILGGVTRHVLKNMSVPVLMAH